MRDSKLALAALDKLLADRPDRVLDDFSEATRRLTALRDALIAEWRGDAENAERMQRLGTLNAVISIVYGTHYPIGSPKWEQLEQARDAFEAFARELETSGER